MSPFVSVVVALLVLLLLYAVFQNRIGIWWVCRRSDRALAASSAEDAVINAYAKLKSLSAEVEYLNNQWRDHVKRTCGEGRGDNPLDPAVELFITHEEMAKHLQEIHAAESLVREQAQKEYAGGDNSFGNFVRLGKKLGMPPEKILWVYVTKHLDGILSYINGHRSQRESVRGRIKDARTYLDLLDAMVVVREKLERMIELKDKARFLVPGYSDPELVKPFKQLPQACARGTPMCPGLGAWVHGRDSFFGVKHNTECDYRNAPKDAAKEQP